MALSDADAESVDIVGRARMGEDAAARPGDAGRVDKLALEFRKGPPGGTDELNVAMQPLMGLYNCLTPALHLKRGHRETGAVDQWSGEQKPERQSPDGTHAHAHHEAAHFVAGDAQHHRRERRYAEALRQAGKRQHYESGSDALQE